MRTFRALAALAALALTTPALAQGYAQQHSTPQFGLGVGITDAGTTMPGYLFFVPINVIPQLRVEPLIGWARRDTDADGKSSDFTMGVGVFWVHPLAAQLQLYAGGRLASQWASYEPANFGANGTSKWSRRDTILALAAGGEYLPIPRVALGAEFQLGYVSVGDTKTTQWNGITATGGGGSGTATQATIFARIYLF